MKKLKLQIENLAVESFDVSGIRAESRGTVAAHMPKPTPGGTTFQTEAVTGSCCDITLAQSCVQTNCFNQCNQFTANSDCVSFTVDPCA